MRRIVCRFHHYAIEDGRYYPPRSSSLRAVVFFSSWPTRSTAVSVGGKCRATRAVLSLSRPSLLVLLLYESSLVNRCALRHAACGMLPGKTDRKRVPLGDDIDARGDPAERICVSIETSWYARVRIQQKTHIKDCDLTKQNGCLLCSSAIASSATFYIC